MNKLLFIAFLSTTSISFSQTTADIFTASEYEYTYLGIDYSHAKFIGDFSQFSSAGSKGAVSIKDDYFEGWNGVVKNEKSKYNLEDALRKEDIKYDLDAVDKINKNTVVEDMEGDAITYSKDDIQAFINESEYNKTEGIGIIFIAEYLDKSEVEACFHFVMISLETKEILLHERMVNAPAGFGLRNYWIKPIYLSIEQIRKSRYKKWKKKYLPK